jgi:hypothetical protein
MLLLPWQYRILFHVYICVICYHATHIAEIFYNPYGSHSVVFITKQTTLIQPHTTQVYFNLFGHLYMCLHASACT